MIKKLTYIIILSIFCANFALAQPKNARIEYNKKPNAKPFGSIYTDAKKVLSTANMNMLLWEKTAKAAEKQFYLEQAMRFYYIAIKIDSSLIDANIGLARVYDMMNLDKLALEYYCKSININPNNAKANLYFGNYYYRRNDVLNALKYYKTAYKNGFSQNFELNYKLGQIYEKLADIQTAIAFYSHGLSLKPQDKELRDKIRLLDELNYAQSQYYLFSK